MALEELVERIPQVRARTAVVTTPPTNQAMREALCHKLQNLNPMTMLSRSKALRCRGRAARQPPIPVHAVLGGLHLAQLMLIVMPVIVMIPRT